MRCKWCKKEFTPNPLRLSQRFCCYNCKREYHGAVAKIKSKVKTVLLKHPSFHVEEDQLKKIINAKILLFAGGDVHRCPCDAGNTYRFCGSLRCIADVNETGHCHCNLFWRYMEKDK